MRKAEQGLKKMQLPKKGAAKPDVGPTENIPVEAEVDFFDAFCEANQPRRSGAFGKIMILVVSLLLFIVSFGIRFTADFLLILVVVLFIHELGHYLGMYLFGFKDLKIVFLPFLGAATIGQPGEVSALKKFFVYIFGPAPGILLGTVCLCFHAMTEQEWLYKFGLFCLILNYLNLLPFMPLDGGRVFELLLFFRYPRLQSLFNYISAGAFLTAAILLSDPIIYAIALFLFLAARGGQLDNRATLRLREILATQESVIEKETVKQIIFGMLREPAFGKVPFKRKCQIAQSLLETIGQRPATTGTIAACMLIYFLVFILPVFIAVSFGMIVGAMNSGLYPATGV